MTRARALFASAALFAFAPSLLTACGAPLAHVATDARWLDPQTGRGSVAFEPREPKGANDAAPVRVVIYGDTRGNREVHRTVVDAMSLAHPDLAIFTGDALSCLPVGHMPDLGVAAYALPFWPQIHRGYPWVTATSVVPFPALVHEVLGGGIVPPRDPDGLNAFLEDTAALRLRDRVPYLFAPGNHDSYHEVDRREVARLFGEDGHAYRALDIGDRFRFLVLDTGTDLFASPDPMPPGGAQLTWLDAQLAEADARNMRTVVVMHMPPFSSGKEDGPVPWVKERVVEGVFDRHRVDLVACGHAHAYERLVRRGFQGRDVPYVVTGGGGAPFHHEDEEAREPGSITFVESTPHYVLVEMTPARMRIRMIPVYGPNDVPLDFTPDDVTLDLGP
jgi:3',5'-cyclic AMP phosphodiesterase CpdA